MFSFTDATSANCRRYVMPACEPDGDYSQSAPLNAVETFQIRRRDTLDFGIDFSGWLSANGASTLTNAVWSVAAGSPQAPTIAGQAFDANGMTVVTISPHAGALPGDAYWLDVTADISATTLAPIIPARQLVRRIYIIVIQG